MKKKYVLFIIFLSLLSIQGQAYNITLELYGKCLCNNSITKISVFMIEKDSVMYMSDSEEQIILSDIGLYHLIPESLSIFTGEAIPIHVNNYGLIQDTVIISSIEEFYAPNLDPSGFFWYCCQKTKCDGYMADYYNNGNMRIEGSFREGKAIGEIKYYNPDGTIRSISCYDKEGKLVNIKHFNEKGELYRQDNAY
ncbi:hypothetical protein M2132_002225 [Dysgonomonas sp. PH5-45]|nr:hypothetical protein [Dysgonomonas sp. PH5-45]MDH6355875.1 hypothetical protein [Dysgonomonas sp. PH5-45]